MSKTLFLSYPLNSEAYGYGNGDRFKLTKVRDICCGDTSNNTTIEMPTHYGTHIDYPFHFSVDGKKSSDYLAQHFIFQNIGFVEVDASLVEDYLIGNKNLVIENISSNIEMLIVKTGFCNKRHTPEYWEYGLGFHPETASFLKEKFPQLKAIAFDLISMNSYQQREIGREAHKEYLIKNDILIIEEVDLRAINSQTIFKEVIVAPLLIENADGAPVTIITKIE
ncbi:MAG: cyclase family protein [Flavobacteriales bacterium]|nr:cyclase family protein [Flavobacteriales bacterium]